MKEYMKNKNEYIEDGKRYVEKIKRCSCYEKINDEYKLFCSIHQRGEKTYMYAAGTDFILKDSSKGFYLSDSARDTVENAVKEFEKTVESVKNGDAEMIEIKELNLTFYCKKPAVFADCFIEEYTDNDNNIVTEIHECGILSLLRIIQNHYFKNKENAKLLEKLKNPDEQTITENPVYMLAVRSGDELLQLKIKLYYNIATKRDCERLSELLGERVLPKLSDKFDRGYAVKKEGISYSLLGRSGYAFLHRPNIAMYGSTRSKYTLNPHTRSFVDAAKTGSEPITFEEFLKLFEEVENYE